MKRIAIAERVWVFALSMTVFCAAHAAAAVPSGSLDGSTLYLRAGTVQTGQLPDVRAQLSGDCEPNRPYVIQLDGPMTPVRRAAINKAGIALGDYLPLNAYVANLTDV